MEFDAIARKLLVPNQHYMFYLIMCFARYNLYVQSFMRLFNQKRHTYLHMFELATLIGFHWWQLHLCFYNGLWTGLGYLLLSHAVSGILEVQIILNHYSRPCNTGRVPDSQGQVYAGDFFSRQVVTCMDVSCEPYLDWFHGGLHMQTVHHLFPRVVRTRLREATELIKPICAKHNLPYKSVGFFAANYEILRHLKAVGQSASTWDHIVVDAFNARG